MLGESFFQVFTFLLVGAGFIISALLLSRLLSPKRPNPEKLAAYESGEVAKGPSWPGISSGYYVIALLFLLFEVEIILLFPLIIRMTGTSPAEQAVLVAQNANAAISPLTWIFIEIVGFVLVLSVGLAYAWSNGHLDWLKPQTEAGESTHRSPVPRSRYEEFNKRMSR